MNELQDLRERGAARCDPVHWRFIEALARRAQAHEGAARALLDARLQALLAAFVQRHALAFERGTGTPEASNAARPRQAVAAAASPLQGLNDHLAQHAAPAGSELQTLEWFRRTWSRINVGRRMTQSLAKKPENAGPINSHGLVLRALQQLGAVSPDYLDRFVAYADTLLTLDQAGGGSAMPHRDVLHRDVHRDVRRSPGAVPSPAAAGAPRRPRTAARTASRAAAKTADQPAVATLKKR